MLLLSTQRMNRMTTLMLVALFVGVLPDGLSVDVYAEKPGHATVPAKPSKTPDKPVTGSPSPSPTTGTTKAKESNTTPLSIPTQAKPSEEAKPRGAKTSVVAGSPVPAYERVRRYPGPWLSILENRDGQGYSWTLHCGRDFMSGMIQADAIVHFRRRGGSGVSCELQLVGQNNKLPIGTGERLIIRQGRLFALKVTTVVYPPVATVGDVDLVKGPNLSRQWAVSATASSEYTNTSWSAMQATGPANVDTCADSASAWATKAADHGLEWLSLTYKNKVRAIGVVVYINLNPGAVVKVEAQTGAGWTTVWEGKDPSKGICPAKLSLRFTEPVDTQSIRLTLDTRLVPGWNEIDAVELVSMD